MKTIIVTGASRGLGLVIAEILVNEGYRVVAASRKCSDSLTGLQQRYTQERIIWLPLDLEQVSLIHDFILNVNKKYGPIYGLVNNAAIGLDGILATQHDSDIARVIQVNLTATTIITKYAVRAMLANRLGRIINISSIAAYTGFNGLSVYAATKAALIGFSGALAREIGRAGITVNCIAPGFLQTDMTAGLEGPRLDSIKRRTPRGQLPTLNEVAHSVVFLLSPNASGITGTTITVDAGSTA